MVTRLVTDIEKARGSWLSSSRAVSREGFSSTELLVLQARMYKYTQELELTGKVVEGHQRSLDTLKTQV